MIDQPGKLYLGREVAPGLARADGPPVSLGLRDLTTHAVILGMTGTGKTGLGVGLLEEVLLQGVPAIIIDPKGDLTNLALSFPELRGEDFAPWVDPGEAALQGKPAEGLAAETAERWRVGLADWGIAPGRLSAFHDRVDVRIYTPGSMAGIPVSVLRSFDPPQDGLNWTSHTDALRERIAQIVSALLGLLGYDGDDASITSREHILLSKIFEAAWRAGQPIDLVSLIRMIQEPPVTRIGAFDLDAFFPKGERFDLALRVNNLAASPSFAAWQTGAPLDIAELLRPLRGSGGVSPAGKTRASVFYLAHLDDAGRQFFITLLLSQLVLWMRSQPGTPTLRSVLYFDEVFGYCPPFPRNPPTKTPLMTLIKQGRAAGVGMVLGTQNPADLDYKGLANIGTWFIGRLRTGRDRERALEGLEGAGVGFDREQFEDALSTLAPRTFLLQTAAGMPRFMQSRWAMSYLRGPLTRDQVAGLADARGWPGRAAPGETPAPVAAAPDLHVARPALPPDVPQTFLHLRAPRGRMTYRPHLLFSATVQFRDREGGAAAERVTLLTPAHEPVAAPDFGAARRLDHFDPGDGAREPAPDAAFDGLPPGLDARALKIAERAFAEHVYRTAGLRVWRQPVLKAQSRPGEDRAAFLARCEALAEPRIRAEAGKLHDQYARRIADLQDRLARERRELGDDQAELDARKREAMLTNVESVFNLIVGRRSLTSLSRGATKARQRELAELDVRASERAMEDMNARIEGLAAEYQAALAALRRRWADALAVAEERMLRPNRSDVRVDVAAVAWVA